MVSTLLHNGKNLIRENSDLILKLNVMKELSFEKMDVLNGGGVISNTCRYLALGSGMYALGLAFHWWNPVGWVSAGFIVGNLACGIYAFS